MNDSTIHWASPYSLGLLAALALAGLAGFVLLRWASGRPIEPARRRGLLLLRLAIVALIALILFNPVRVDVTPGTVERPKVFYLLDASQSMALGKGTTRWDQVVETIRSVDRKSDPVSGAQVSAFRFGSRLAAVDAPFWRPHEGPSAFHGQPGQALAAAPTPPVGDAPAPAPTDADTLLADSLEGLANRFGQSPPQAVVVFSDGRARDPERADVIARAYGRMKIPVHVVPVGDEQVGGDIAIVSMVAPNTVRKYTHVAAQVFVRSYGYNGKRAELKIVTLGPDGKPGSVLAHVPIVLPEGLTSFPISFESDNEDHRIAALIDVQPGEVSSSNNMFTADLAIDHTKIRVLYLEGATDRFVTKRGAAGVPGLQIRGAYASLQDALMEDADIECTAILPAGAGGDFSALVRADERSRGLPETPSELFAYDALILSNVPREALSDQHLAWLEEWIGRRGGGLCMVGGPNSFSAGNWGATPVGKMLPVELSADGADWTDGLTSLQPVAGRSLHPIWHISSDENQNRAILKTMPDFLGHNRIGHPKSAAEVLAGAASSAAGAESFPGIVVQPFGRGRSMAMSTAITRRYATDFTQSWGGNDARYYKKFWRNTIYWLTENSSIGRRRLLAETDKRLYRPGEPIAIQARTFDENAAATLDYRVAVSVEPRSASDVSSDDSPLRRPAVKMLPADEQARVPMLPWGEEFDLARNAPDKSYAALLPIIDAKSAPAGVALTQGLRIELTAYENNTQVDSTALEVQILDDPSEQQNPLPDHDLLRRVAERSGGRVLKGADDLASMLAHLPRVVGPTEVKRAPIWSRWWLLGLLLVLLTTEWVWRRRLGLA